MTEGEQVPFVSRPSRWVWAAMSVAMLGAASVLMVQKVETFDSYCGSVLYDTHMAAPCDDEMSWRRMVVGLLLLVGLGVLVAAIVGGRDGPNRTAAIVAAGALVVFFLGVFLTANRLLQPGEGWCGSVMNRHRTYERQREAWCDDRLRPHLLVGLAWAWMSLCALAAALWAMLHLRTRAE